MANKQVTLILNAANRTLWQGGAFTLRIHRQDSNGIKAMRFQTSNGPRRTKLESDQPTLQLDLDLAFNRGQRYILHADAPGHRGIFHVLHRRSFISREDGADLERPDAIVRTIMIPDRAASSDLDGGFDKLRDRGSPLVETGIGISRDEYQALTPSAKMAMLNIEAKLRSTRIDGTPLGASVTGLRRVKPDRIFVMMKPPIKDMVDRSGAFAPAPGHGSGADRIVGAIRPGVCRSDADYAAMT